MGPEPRAIDSLRTPGSPVRRAAGTRQSAIATVIARSNALSDDTGQRANKHPWQHDRPVVTRLAERCKGLSTNPTAMPAASPHASDFRHRATRPAASPVRTPLIVDPTTIGSIMVGLQGRTTPIVRRTRQELHPRGPLQAACSCESPPASSHDGGNRLDGDWPRASPWDSCSAPLWR